MWPATLSIISNCAFDTLNSNSLFHFPYILTPFEVGSTVIVASSTDCCAIRSFSTESEFRVSAILPPSHRTVVTFFEPKYPDVCKTVRAVRSRGLSDCFLTI